MIGGSVQWCCSHDESITSNLLLTDGWRVRLMWSQSPVMLFSWWVNNFKPFISRLSEGQTPCKVWVHWCCSHGEFKPSIGRLWEGQTPCEVRVHRSCSHGEFKNVKNGPLSGLNWALHLLFCWWAHLWQLESLVLGLSLACYIISDVGYVGIQCHSRRHPFGSLWASRTPDVWRKWEQGRLGKP